MAFDPRTQYPGLLGGDPIDILMAQGVGQAPNPFAGQYTPTGMLPRERTLPPARSPVESALQLVAGNDVLMGGLGRDVRGRQGRDHNPNEAPAVDPSTWRGTITDPAFIEFDPFNREALASESLPMLSTTPYTERVADAHAEKVWEAQEKLVPGLKLKDIPRQSPIKSIGQFLNKGSNVAALFAPPGVGYLLNAIERMTTKRIARDDAFRQMGLEGYETGMVGGAPYSISPGLFGPNSSVLTGNVPVGIDIDDINRMGLLMNDINPYAPQLGEDEYEDFVGGNRGGIGGYVEDGGWVDEYGNWSALGPAAGAKELAEENNISEAAALTALNAARDGKMSLSEGLSQAAGGRGSLTDRINALLGMKPGVHLRTRPEAAPRRSPPGIMGLTPPGSPDDDVLSPAGYEPFGPAGIPGWGAMSPTDRYKDTVRVGFNPAGSFPPWDLDDINSASPPAGVGEYESTEYDSGDYDVGWL